MPRVLEALQAHFDGLSPLYECENRLRMKCGQYRWNIDRGKVVERAADGSPLRMVGTDSDFSLRRRAQEVLQESEERERKRAADLAALLDAVPTPVLVAHDTGCLKIDGNRSADLLLRNTRGENVSIARANRRQPLHFRVLKDGRELSDDELPIQKAARGIPVENFEFSVLFEDGVRRDLLAYGTPLKDQYGRPRGAVLGMFDITERKRDEQHRQLHYEVTRLLADLGSVEETIPVLLQTLAEAFGWQMGEFWEYSSTDRCLTLSHVWHARRKKLSDFAKQARLLSASMSKGLPGRVLATGNPEWVPNISQCPYFVQKRAAAQAGLRVAFAFPSKLGNEVVGALVFLGKHAVEPDGLLIRMLKSMGSQIAQFIQRKKNEQALREAHEFGNQVMNGTQAGIVVCDQSNRVIAWNPFMERFTGCASESVLGRFAQDVFLQLRVQDFDKLAGKAMDGEVFEAADMLLEPLGEKEKAWTTARFAPLRDANQQIVGVIVAFRDITDRRRLENEVLEISDREQQRIGHDLHDGLGQQLTALEMKNFLIQQDLAVEDLEARKASLLQLAAEMGKALRDCITTTRSLARGLAPMTLKTEGLSGALYELAHQSNVPGGIRCRFVCSIPDRIESSQTAGHLYRIAQEAVNNACKHSSARMIEISLSRTQGVLRLKIADDGSGLSPSVKAKSGMGLEVMRHRAHLIGASLDIESQPGKGVEVVCKLPLEKYEH